MATLNNLDKVCKKPCNFLDIRPGARNFAYASNPNDARFYAYYVNKVAVRYIRVTNVPGIQAQALP